MATVGEEAGPWHDLERRVKAIEAGYRDIGASSEALVLRAEGHLKAARSAEERARGMVNRAEQLSEADEGDEEGLEGLQEWAQLIRAGNDEGGGEEAVPPVYSRVEARRAGKAAAKAVKFNHN